MCQVADRKLFLDTAKEKNAEIVVVRSTTIIPQIDGTKIRMVDALWIQGSFRFHDGGTIACWIYREEKPWDDTCLDEMGRLSEVRLYAGTLWEELERRVKADILAGAPPLKVRLHLRTGSF